MSNTATTSPATTPAGALRLPLLATCYLGIGDLVAYEDDSASARLYEVTGAAPGTDGSDGNQVTWALTLRDLQTGEERTSFWNLGSGLYAFKLADDRICSIRVNGEWSIGANRSHACLVARSEAQDILNGWS